MDIEGNDSWDLFEYDLEHLIDYEFKLDWQETYEFINFLPTRNLI